MTGGRPYLTAVLASGLLLVAGTDLPAGHVPSVDPASNLAFSEISTAELIRRETALIEQVRLAPQSAVLYALIDLADPARPDSLNDQLRRILDDLRMDPPQQAAWMLYTLSAYLDRARIAAEKVQRGSGSGDAVPPTGQRIATGYRRLDELILRHLADRLAPEVVEVFKERFVTLACIDVSRWKLESFSAESYSALGDLLDAYPRDGHVRQLLSTTLDIHQRLQATFGQQVLREMNEIESGQARGEISDPARAEAYRSILERIHREIARYKALREIAFTLEVRVDLQTPQRYYLRALGRAFDFEYHARDPHAGASVPELARVVIRHMAEWHVVSKLLFFTTLVAEGPKGMHQWMYGTIDCPARTDAVPAPKTVSKSDRCPTHDGAHACNVYSSPEYLASCCGSFKQRRFLENWNRLVAIVQDVQLNRGSGSSTLGAPRRDSLANVFAEAISSRIVTDHTDLIGEVHQAVQCIFDPRDSRACPGSGSRFDTDLRSFREKLREPAESAVFAEAIDATIDAIALDPRVPDGVILEKIEQLAEMLVLVQTRDSLETLLGLFDRVDRVFVAAERRKLGTVLESKLVLKLREFVEVNRLVDPQGRRLTSAVLDHLLMRCRDVSVDPFGDLYEYRYIRALGRIMAIQPKLAAEEKEITKDDLINDLVTYHATNPGLFVSSVFHLSALLLDCAEHWTFWNSGATDAQTNQAARVFGLLSWVSSSLGRASADGMLANVALSSDDVEEVRTVLRAYRYYTPKKLYGRLTLARNDPAEFHEAILPLMQRWIHLLPRYLIDRMRKEVVLPLTVIARGENAEAARYVDRAGLFTDRIRTELELLVSLIQANHNKDRRDREIIVELQESVQPARRPQR